MQKPLGWLHRLENYGPLPQLGVSSIVVVRGMFKRQKIRGQSIERETQIHQELRLVGIGARCEKCSKVAEWRATVAHREVSRVSEKESPAGMDLAGYVALVLGGFWVEIAFIRSSPADLVQC